MRIRFGLLVLLVAAAGCSGGDDDDVDGNAGLETGLYTASGTVIVSDECDTQPAVDEYDGVQFDITEVTAVDVTFDTTNGPVALQRNGNVISNGRLPLGNPIDWNTEYADPPFSGSALSRPYDCIEQDFATFELTILSETTMDLRDSTEYTHTAGTPAECVAANTSAYGIIVTAWPCETEITADVAHD